MIVSDQTLTIEMIRKLQMNEFYLLRKFNDFCVEHKINYTLDFGSIIGAVRHKGFIPWDDDIDIAMIRRDYDKFLELSAKWNNELIFVQNYFTDPNFVHSFTRLRLNNSLAVQEDWAHLYVHHGIFIDVFPYDVVPSTKEEIKRHEYEIYEIQEAKLKRVKLLKADDPILWERAKIHNPLCKKPLKELNEIQTKVMTRYNKMYSDNSFISHMSQGLPTYYEFRRKAGDHLQPSYEKFEGQLFPIPSSYDFILRNTYGDYMKYPPVEERVPHHGFIEIVFNESIVVK